MEFNVMDKILGARNLRSKGYKAIAKYITENTKQAAFMTAGAIAKEIVNQQWFVLRHRWDIRDIRSFIKLLDNGCRNR